MTGQLDLLATVTPTRPTAPATLLVLEALEDGPKCGLWFTQHYGMARYSARIMELRDAGWRIEQVPCRCGRHTRQKSPVAFRLVTP